MQFSQWLVFCGVALLVTFTPGPAVLMAIANTIGIGARRAFIASLGNAVGLLIVSAAAMAGMGVLLATSATAFTLVKLSGAGYLIYLGLRQWRNRHVPLVPDTDAAPIAPRSTRRLFAQGMGVALTNPKAILFFSALFPQFIRPELPVFDQFAVLTVTFSGCALCSHLVYITLARTLRQQFARPARARAFNIATGSLFVVLGIGLLRLPRQAA